MELRLLGPVEVRLDDRVLAARRPQQNAVLAALAVDANRLVPVDALVDRVWGDDPPRHARRTLQTHIARIRRLLEQAGGPDATQLARGHGGYLLRVDADRVDLHRFGNLVAQARSPQCDDSRRVVLLREALALWRSEPLAGLTGEWAEQMRRSWRQERLDATVAWAYAELHADNAGRLIGPLTALAAEHPLAENLVGVLLRALYAAGRAGEALECYATIRQRLADELGTHPGPDLQHTYQAILRDELERPRQQAPPPPGRSPNALPAMLPLDVYGFAGRSDQLARLDALLHPAADADQPAAAPLSVISGTAGVGKTALAVHWAHRVRAEFPDGQLYVNLHGFDPSSPVMEPHHAVRGFLDALGVPAQRIPADLEQQVGLYRSLLVDRRTLVVLDNARDAAQVRPLLPGGPRCVVVVTSRNRLTGLVAAEGAQPLTLKLLNPAEARDLLVRRLGEERLAAEPEAIDEIIARCTRLPLALVVVAARAATEPDLGLAALADDLRGAQDGLDAFTGDDPATDVRTVLSWSFGQLSRDAARLFRLLGLHPGPDVTTPAAASFAGVSTDRVQPLLTELTGAHLLAEHAPGRFAFHDLLRVYAAELARDDPDTERRVAIHRMLDHYLHTAYEADRLINPHRPPISLAPPVRGVTPERLAGYEPADSWLTDEHPVLLRAIEQAAAAGLDTHTWQLSWVVWTFLNRRGRWSDHVDTLTTALHALERLADRPGEIDIRRYLARAYTWLGWYDDAQAHLGRALDRSDEIDDRAGKADIHLVFGFVCERQGNYQQALAHARQALALHQSIGQRIGQARALNQIGWYHAKLGEYERALVHCQDALTLHEALGSQAGQAATADSLGYAHHHLGHYREAVACYELALRLRRSLGDRYEEAGTLTHLGDSHRAAGDDDSARTAWRQALEILTGLRHPDVDEVRARLDAPG